MISAREKALGYLSRFARTERQVADYLRRKDFPDEEIGETLAFLRERGFVNDRSFAESYIEARVRHCDGPLKIKHLLFQKGIAPRLTDELLRSFYPFELQVEKAKTLITTRRGPADPAARRRLTNFVASRGFSRYVIIQAFREIG